MVSFLPLTWGQVLLCFVSLRTKREGTEHRDSDSSQRNHRQEFADVEETGNLSQQEVCSFVSEVMLKPCPLLLGSGRWHLVGSHRSHVAWEGLLTVTPCELYIF